MKLVDLIQLFEGDKAGVLALVLRDQDHIVSLQEVFFCNERHDILRIPREGAGSHGIDLESRFGAVDRLTAVEDGGGAVVMKEGDGLTCGVHPCESLPSFLPGAMEHDAGGDEKGKESVDRDGCAADLFKAPCEVLIENGCQYRKGEEAWECVGGVLGGNECKEKIDDDEIDQEQLRHIRCVSEVKRTGSPFFCETVGDEEAPGGKADEVNDEVEVPFILARMLGDGSAKEIVDTEEIEQKIRSVEVAHGAVPCAGDHGEEDEAGEEMDVLHFFEVFVVGEEEQGGKTGKEKTDGPLGEDGKGGGYVAEVVVPSVFGVAQVEEGDCHTHEEEECRVSDDGFREEPAFDRGAQDDGR